MGNEEFLSEARMKSLRNESSPDFTPIETQIVPKQISSAKPKISRKAMLELNKRYVNRLPEVVRQREDDIRKAQYELNRKRAAEFKNRLKEKQQAKREKKSLRNNNS